MRARHRQTSRRLAQSFRLGLNGVHSITSIGDGKAVGYWNRYVGVTQMGGHGSFSEPRTGVNVTNGPDDLVTAKLTCAAGTHPTSTMGRRRRSRRWSKPTTPKSRWA